MWRKIVADHRPVCVHCRYAVVQIQFDDGIAIIHGIRIVRRRCVKSTIARSSKDSPIGLAGRHIRCESSATHPDTRGRCVGCGAPSARLRQSGPVVSHDPAVTPTVDLATTYIVSVVGSMTGVLVIPISGTMSLVRTSPEGTVVSPPPSSETFHNGFALAALLRSDERRV